MSSSRIIELVKALKTELETELNRTVNRKYVAYSPGSIIKSEQINIYPFTDDSTIVTRCANLNIFEIVIEIVQSLPESGNQSISEPDADINNLDFLDQRMATVQTVRDLFTDTGALKDKLIGGCYSRGIDQPSLYVADALVSHRVFWSAFKVTFTFAE